MMDIGETFSGCDKQGRKRVDGRKKDEGTN